jgi:hypothetical protein
MKKPIKVSKILSNYRTELYKNYPEPKAKTQEDKEAEQTGKKKDKKDKTLKDTTPVVSNSQLPAASKDATQEDEYDSDDSVIADLQDQDFTVDVSCIRGSEYHPKVQDYIK